MNIYAVVDVVSDKVYEVGMGDSDASFIRANLPILLRTKPRSDIKVFCLMQFDDDFDGTSITDAQFGNFEGREVDLDCYKFDEVTAQYMSKTEAVQQIEMYKKSRELQLEKMRIEIEKAKQDLNKD